jgi:cytochrome c oxidase assembly factor 1
MERRADRALPTVASSSFRWLRTLPIFAVIMIASTLGIFNYQKQSSSVVSSTLYALRTNPEARQILGDEIYFAYQIPWISGEINQLHGRINISFWVKGTKGRGLMRFKSERKSRMGFVSYSPFGRHRVYLRADV